VIKPKPEETVEICRHDVRSSTVSNYFMYYIDHNTRIFWCRCVARQIGFNKPEIVFVKLKLRPRNFQIGILLLLHKMGTF